MFVKAAVDVPPDHLTRVIDAECFGAAAGAGIVERGVGAGVRVVQVRIES